MGRNALAGMARPVLRAPDIGLVSLQPYWRNYCWQKLQVWL